MKSWPCPTSPDAVKCYAALVCPTRSEAWANHSIAACSVTRTANHDSTIGTKQQGHPTQQSQLKTVGSNV
jgi:hypothetical protein